MFSKKKLTTIPIIILLIFSSFITLVSIDTSAAATPSSGSTTLYFRNPFFNTNPDLETDSLDYTLLSETVPTKINDSFYPPKILNGMELNVEEMSEWITYWAILLSGFPVELF
jgi:hypothetical protein